MQYKKWVTCPAKPVIQMTKDGKEVARYASMNIASSQTSVCYSSIWKCCNGISLSAGGFTWAFLPVDVVLYKKLPYEKWSFRGPPSERKPPRIIPPEILTN